MRETVQQDSERGVRERGVREKRREKDRGVRETEK